MPLTGVAASIAPLRQTLPVKITGGSYIGSRWVEGDPTTGTRNLAPLPLTSRDFKSLEAGKYTVEDIKFYHIVGDGDPLKRGDLVEYEGLTRSIEKITNRTADGGFLIYFSKVVQ